MTTVYDRCLRALLSIALPIASCLVATAALGRTPLAITPPDDLASTRVFLSHDRELTMRVSHEVELSHEQLIQETTPYVFVSFSPRVQLSVHGLVVTEQRSTYLDGIVPEIRCSLGAYGSLPLNPVLGAGLSLEGVDPSAVHGLLQLSSKLGRGHLWAANLVYEQEINGPRNRELLLTSGIRRGFPSRQFGVGVEAKAELARGKAAGSPWERQLLVGPSGGRRLGEHSALQVNSLFGLSRHAPRNETNVLWVYAR